jgi:hypothetical protein
VQVCEGETIRGTLSCKPNAKNPRDLDIVLEYHFEGKHCEAHRTQVRPAVAGWDGQHRCVQMNSLHCAMGLYIYNAQALSRCAATPGGVEGLQCKP